MQELVYTLINMEIYLWNDRGSTIINNFRQFEDGFDNII